MFISKLRIKYIKLILILMPNFLFGDILFYYSTAILSSIQYSNKDALFIDSKTFYSSEKISLKIDKKYDNLSYDIVIDNSIRLKIIREKNGNYYFIMPKISNGEHSILIHLDNTKIKLNFNIDASLSTTSKYDLVGIATLNYLIDSDIYLFKLNNLNDSIAYYHIPDELDKDKASKFKFDNISLEENTFYLLKLSFGSDIIEDSNGMLDSSSKEPVRGNMFSIVSARQLIDGKASISVLSDIIYRTYQSRVFSYDFLSLQKLLDTAAKKYIEDINNDRNIDYNDILFFNGLKNRASLLIDYSDFASYYAPLILKDSNRSTFLKAIIDINGVDVTVNNGLFQKIPSKIQALLEGMLPDDINVTWSINNKNSGIIDKTINKKGIYNIKADFFYKNEYIKTLQKRLYMTEATNTFSLAVSANSDVNISSDIANIQVFEGGVSQDTKIVLNKSFMNSIMNSKYVNLSDTIILEPDGLQFDIPAEITIPYFGDINRTILVKRHNKDGNEDFIKPVFVDEKNHKVTFLTEHFTDFVLTGDYIPFYESVSEAQLEDIKKRTGLSFSDKRLIECLNEKIAGKNNKLTMYDVYLQHLQNEKVYNKLKDIKSVSQFSEALSILYPDNDAIKATQKTWNEVKSGLEWIERIQNVGGSLANGQIFKASLALFDTNIPTNGVEYVNYRVGYSPISMGSNLIKMIGDNSIGNQIKKYFINRSDINGNCYDGPEYCFESVDNCTDYCTNKNGWYSYGMINGEGNLVKNPVPDAFWHNVESLYQTKLAYNPNFNKIFKEQLELINKDLKAIEEQIEAEKELKRNPKVKSYIAVNNYSKEYEKSEKIIAIVHFRPRGFETSNIIYANLTRRNKTGGYDAVAGTNKQNCKYSESDKSYICTFNTVAPKEVGNYEYGAIIEFENGVQSHNDHTVKIRIVKKVTLDKIKIINKEDKGDGFLYFQVLPTFISKATNKQVDIDYEIVRKLWNKNQVISEGKFKIHKNDSDFDIKVMMLYNSSKFISYYRTIDDTITVDISKIKEDVANCSLDEKLENGVCVPKTCHDLNNCPTFFDLQPKEIDVAKKQLIRINGKNLNKNITMRIENSNYCIRKSVKNNRIYFLCSASTSGEKKIFMYDVNGKPIVNSELAKIKVKQPIVPTCTSNQKYSKNLKRCIEKTCIDDNYKCPIVNAISPKKVNQNDTVRFSVFGDNMQSPLYGYLNSVRCRRNNQSNNQVQFTCNVGSRGVKSFYVKNSYNQIINGGYFHIEVLQKDTCSINASLCPRCNYYIEKLRIQSDGSGKCVRRFAPVSLSWSGKLLFKDSNGKNIRVPRNTKIRITPSQEQREGKWGGIVVSVSSNGYWTTKGKTYNINPYNYRSYRKYQFVVFNDSNKDNHWERNEKAYRPYNCKNGYMMANNPSYTKLYEFDGKNLEMTTGFCQ